VLLNSTNVFVPNVSSMYLDRNFIVVFAMAIQHEYKLKVGNSTHVDYNASDYMISKQNGIWM